MLLLKQMGLSSSFSSLEVVVTSDIKMGHADEKNPTSNSVAVRV